MDKETIKFLAKVRPLGIYSTRKKVGSEIEYTYFPYKGVRLGGEDEIEVFLLENGKTIATSRKADGESVERTFIGYIVLEEVLAHVKKSDLLKSLLNLAKKKQDQHLEQLARIEKIKESLECYFADAC